MGCVGTKFTKYTNRTDWNIKKKKVYTVTSFIINVPFNSLGERIFFEHTYWNIVSQHNFFLKEKGITLIY
jgi:hypothetical protein